jgi:hypothetical protein
VPIKNPRIAFAILGLVCVSEQGEPAMSQRELRAGLVSRPTRSTQKLAFAELEAAACFGAAVFFAFHHAAIARHEA